MVKTGGGEIRTHDVQVIKRRRYRLRNLLIRSISEVQNHGTIIQRKTVIFVSVVYREKQNFGKSLFGDKVGEVVFGTWM